MVRSRVLLAAAVLVTLPLAGVTSHAATVREPVAFTVTNPLDPGKTYTVHGVLVRPAAGCSGSVLLAMHGLSYGAWAWDFPLRPETYSVAQALADRGFATLAVDELGYGTSAGEGAPDHPNGYTLTVESYAEMTAQMVAQIRAGTYQAASPTPFSHVGLLGHSAGSEIVELAAGLHPGIADVVIATGYTHEPFVDNDWLIREWSQDNLRALQDDYEYFETNPTIRAHDMYWLPNADADVVGLDTSMANLTPSGEVFSIGIQPSRFVLWRITVPVLVVLGEHDALFPGRFGPNEMKLFLGAKDKTLRIAQNAGHAMMLQRNAPSTNTKIANWLDAHQGKLPHC